MFGTYRAVEHQFGPWFNFHHAGQFLSRRSISIAPALPLLMTAPFTVPEPPTMSPAAMVSASVRWRKEHPQAASRRSSSRARGGSGRCRPSRACSAGSRNRLLVGCCRRATASADAAAVQHRPAGPCFRSLPASTSFRSFQSGDDDASSHGRLDPVRYRRLDRWVCLSDALRRPGGRRPSGPLLDLVIRA